MVGLLAEFDLLSRLMKLVRAGEPGVRVTVRMPNVKGEIMICYVDMEHEKALQGAEKWAVHQVRHMDIKRRLEETSGDICLMRQYRRVTWRWLSESKLRALVISGNATDWTEYNEEDLLEMYRIIRSAELPILGLCGGCQLIAMAHGAPLGPMRRLKEGENDSYEDFAQGYFKEWGFVPVHVLRSDPLFDGLGEEPVFLAAHYWEVKKVPPSFELLASSDACQIQVIKQAGKFVYGTQFHPEAYTEGQADRRSWLINRVYPEDYVREQAAGRRLLANFFRMAGILG